MPFDRRFVLGVPVDAVTEEDVLAFVRERIERHAPAQIVTVNAEYVVQARRTPEFMEVLRRADLATPDGAGVIWALRRHGVEVPRRVGGSDLVWSLAEQASQLGHHLFLLGAAPGVANTAAKRLQERYPGLSIAGTWAGSPAADEEADIVDLIRRANTDILFVAFGAPGQDLWISRTLRRTGASVALGVGGSLDYVAGIALRAPIWMQEAGLEWLWRPIRQPWRWKRMLALPEFAWLVLRAGSNHKGERTGRGRGG